MSAAARARVAAGVRPASLKVADEILRALVGEGLTVKEIARQAGLSCGSVRARVRALGLESSAIAHFRLRASDSELLALRREGLRASQIAARTGMNVPAINARFSRLRRRGVDVPPPAVLRPRQQLRVGDE